jgi:hypothetical protein
MQKRKAKSFRSSSSIIKMETHQQAIEADEGVKGKAEPDRTDH